MHSHRNIDRCSVYILSKEQTTNPHIHIQSQPVRQLRILSDSPGPVEGPMSSSHNNSTERIEVGISGAQVVYARSVSGRLHRHSNGPASGLQEVCSLPAAAVLLLLLLHLPDQVPGHEQLYRADAAPRSGPATHHRLEKAHSGQALQAAVFNY